MISVDDALSYHQDQLECLRLVKRMARGLQSPRFANFTPQQLLERLEEVRAELDRQVVLLLVASTEGALRRDYAARVQAATSPQVARWRRLAFLLHLPRFLWSNVGTVEERLVDLQVRYADKVPLDEVLDVWKFAGADASLIGRFRQVVRHRHWLAHGRYFRDRSGLASPDPRGVHTLVSTMFQDLTALRADFPRS